MKTETKLNIAATLFELGSELNKDSAFQDAIALTHQSQGRKNQARFSYDLGKVEHSMGHALGNLGKCIRDRTLLEAQSVEEETPQN